MQEGGKAWGDGEVRHGGFRVRRRRKRKRKGGGGELGRFRGAGSEVREMAPVRGRAELGVGVDGKVIGWVVYVGP